MSPALDPLVNTMRRVGAAVPPHEFVSAVVQAFRNVVPVTDEEMERRFRRTRGYLDFRALLREAALPPGSRVIAIGCGRTCAGRRSGYAASVIRECYPRVDITEWNLEGPERCHYLPPAALVVTHSLLHYLHDMAPVCELIQSLVAPEGRYLMVHEPNARFYANPECRQVLELVGASERRRRHLLRYANPARYISRLLRAQRNRASAMNQFLRQRLGLSGDLSAKELSRIIDPHLPDYEPGESLLGSEGLNWDALESGFLAGLRVEQVRTSGYIMRDNPVRVPTRWRKLDEYMTARYPLDGCSFSALWVKPEHRG